MENEAMEQHGGGFHPSPRAMLLKENRDLLDNAVEEWHDSPEDGTSLHEFLGVSLEEYGWIMTPQDWIDHRENYLDFMDYLVRNTVEKCV